MHLDQTLAMRAIGLVWNLKQPADLPTRTELRALQQQVSQPLTGAGQPRALEIVSELAPWLTEKVDSDNGSSATR